MTPKRRRLSVEARREELLDAALAVAAGGDLAAVSVADIAARADVSEGLLYHYFPNKQALITAAVSRAAQTLLDDLKDADGSGTPAERLDAALDAYLRHVREQPTGWRALLAANAGELAQVAAEVERQSHEFILTTLGITKPSPALKVALAGWSAFERDACLAWLDHEDLPQQAVKEMLFTTFAAAASAASAHDPALAGALQQLDQPALDEESHADR